MNKPFLHVSGLGSTFQTKSNYLISKKMGEEFIENNNDNYIIIRPSTVYGEEDKFFNLFGSANIPRPTSVSVVNVNLGFLSFFVLLLINILFIEVYLSINTQINYIVLLKNNNIYITDVIIPIFNLKFNNKLINNII